MAVTGDQCKDRLCKSFRAQAGGNFSLQCLCSALEVRKVAGAVVHGTEQEQGSGEGLRHNFPFTFCWCGMVLSGSFAVEQQDQRLLKSPWTLVSWGVC